jgi:predicted peroxiredoxin
MSQYLMIESRDPFECNEARNFYELAAGLARAGNQVRLFLVQNGVLPARRSTRSDLLARAAEAGVEILADDFSLRERGISPTRLLAGLESAAIDLVVDRLVAGDKVIWH